MAAPRKVFRIEETTAALLPRRSGGPLALRPPLRLSGEEPQADVLQTEIVQVLGALRATMAATVRPATTNAVHDDGERLGIDAAHLTRIGQELDAVVAGTAQATQKILAAAEEIDQAADNLSAALKGRIEQDAAKDIQEVVIRIFEACNFQDLIGQRVTKVMAILKSVEEHIARVVDQARHAPPPSLAVDTVQYLHGPRLESDHGHVTQAEIDAMFEDT